MYRDNLLLDIVAVMDVALEELQWIYLKISSGKVYIGSTFSFILEIGLSSECSLLLHRTFPSTFKKSVQGTGCPWIGTTVSTSSPSRST